MIMIKKRLLLDALIQDIKKKEGIQESMDQFSFIDFE